MKKIIVPIICLVILVIYFITSSLKDNFKEEIKHIKVAEVTHSIFYAPLYVAKELGYFEEEGLDVEIILTSGANNVASAVLSKDVEIGFCGSEQTLYVYNEGAKDYLVNFAALTKRDGSFLVSRNNNFDIKKSKGVILGGRTGGMPSMTLNYTLNQLGIDDLKVDTSVDFAALSGAFIGGQGDYVTLFEPNALSLEKDGKGYVVEAIGKLGGEVPYTTFQARKSYIENNPKVIKGFRTAIKKGIDYVLNHNDHDVALVLEDYFVDTSLSDIESVVRRYREIDAWYSDTNIPKEGYEHMQDIVEFNGFLKKRVDYSILVDSE